MHEQGMKYNTNL